MHVQSTTDTGLKVCVCFDYINTEPYTQIVGLDVIVVFPSGLFSNDHLQYEYFKRENALDVPTLAEMTQAAIHVLKQESKGYFLLVSEAECRARNQYTYESPVVSLL